MAWTVKGQWPLKNGTSFARLKIRLRDAFFMSSSPPPFLQTLWPHHKGLTDTAILADTDFNIFDTTCFWKASQVQIVL